MLVRERTQPYLFTHTLHFWIWKKIYDFDRQQFCVHNFCIMLISEKEEKQQQQQKEKKDTKTAAATTMTIHRQERIFTGTI